MIDRMIPDNILERLERLEAAVRALQMRDVAARQLDEMGDALGEMTYGRIQLLEIGIGMTKRVVNEGETVIISEGYSGFAFGRIEVNGILEVEGDLMIL